jgi:hypothetical protein
MELIRIMDFEFLIPRAGGSAASTSSSMLSEKGEVQQPAEGGTFSALLKDVAQNFSEPQLPLLANPEDPIEPTPSMETDGHATGSALSDIAVALFFGVQDLPEAASSRDDKAESLEGSTKIQLQSVESTPLLPLGVIVVAFPDVQSMRTEPTRVDPRMTRTNDSSIDSSLQPVLDLDRSGETAVMQAGARTTDGVPIRYDRVVPVALSPASLDQPSGNVTLPIKPLPDFLITDQGTTPVMEDQSAKTVIPAASVNVRGQSLERLSAGVQPLAMVQEQGTQQTTLTGQSLSVPVIGVSEGGEQDPFGADAQGAGDGTFFRFGESGTPESVTRGNQSQPFNGQFTLAVQAQSSAPGEGTSVATPAADRLKMTQTLFGEDHSATVTAASGKVQTVHVELPTHDSGPLSVRISMTDQMVHTQFTTDRNDLGALLMGRQDHLQQNLAKSGLELGQFQVHIDQRNQQESLSDRQPRRNGEAPEQQPASQDHNRQAQDRERQNHRASRGLSLFA